MRFIIGALLITTVASGCADNSTKEPRLWTKTILEGRDGGKVNVSSKYGTWSDETIIKTVPSGTEATIIEIKEEALKDGTAEGTRFMRLKVRMDKEPFTEGWVHSYDAGYPMPNFNK